MPQKLTCPLCHKSTTWEKNPYRPFCSLRCKTTDLGNWGSGKYAIPANESSPSDENKEEDVNDKKEQE
ncbi:MAG TPA: DNA gyrase inhibitor YacG [Deltaproteobacteria bacterium]|nr:MAG: hypothetical protein A2048_03595 [Deltaproteobacteria bacterium GWA2_45_12]HBF13148.1 DNA gyrase inhibitor YacG [Deltaproteobacteria bacterium]